MTYVTNGLGEARAARGRAGRASRPVIIDGIRRVARWALSTIREARIRARERAAVEVLSGLSDHTLRDIGIQRSGIRSVARSVVRHPGSDHRHIH